MRKIQSLWGKLSTDNSKWLPLYVHMRDSQQVFIKLWENHLSENVRMLILSDMMKTVPESCCLGILSFLAASHDIGKATPAFQSKVGKNGSNVICNRILSNGLDLSRVLAEPDKIHHSVSSQIILESLGVHRSLAIVAGGHHGNPPTGDDISKRMIAAYPSNLGFNDKSWIEIQKDLFEFCLDLSGISSEIISSARLSKNIQVLVSGLITMTDWISSNESCFPYIDFDEMEVDDVDSRSDLGWSSIGILKRIDYSDEFCGFTDRFGFPARPFQSTLVNISKRIEKPGLTIVEAPTGEGKTEGALAAAEIMMRRFGLKGIFFALPTQATSNGIFPRIESWIHGFPEKETKTIRLAHGKARFNIHYTSLPVSGWNDPGSTDNSLVIHQWFSGKRGMLSDFIVGTVDQVLMMGLKSKHLALRHLGISEKVVIIDECHAYDEYMGSYLSVALKWLGANNIPVILMSATLPRKRKEELMRSYIGKDMEPLKESFGYPAITYSDSKRVISEFPERSGRSFNISLMRITDEGLVGVVRKLSARGGCFGFVMNTVSRAQNLYRTISSQFKGEVHLLHSSFTAEDRFEHENTVIRKLREERPNDGSCMFVIGTQVLEQSLDLDFDVLFTDLCPIDLIIQRIGRLHRHSDTIRPETLMEPCCYIIDSDSSDFEQGSEAIYGKFQLMNSRLLLHDELRIPDDVASLVDSAYCGGVSVSDELRVSYDEARESMELLIKDREQRAKVYQISSPEGRDLVGWVKYGFPDCNDEKAEAKVRDMDGSVEVILVVRDDSGYHTLPDSDGNFIYMPHGKLPDDVALRLASGMVRLPHRICRHGVETVIDSIRNDNLTLPPEWFNSHWIDGELFVILDDDCNGVVMGHHIHYDRELGLVVE